MGAPYLSLGRAWARVVEALAEAVAVCGEREKDGGGRHHWNNEVE